jgi:hypothetical protein
MMGEVIKKAVKIRWPEDPGPALYANNVVVQQDISGMVHLIFFQANPPLLIGTVDEKEAFDKTEAVDAKAIVRIVVPHAQLEGLARILQEHVQIIKNVSDSDARDD